MQSDVAGQLVGVAFVPPETASAAAHVPVGQLVDELLDAAAGVGRLVAAHVAVDLGDEGVQLGQHPAVKLVLGLPIGGLLRGVKLVDLRVADEE